MEYLLYYLLRASVSMVLFYGFYKLFFGKNTFHAMNRFMLIAFAAMTLLLPLFRFNFLPELQKATNSGQLSWELSAVPVIHSSNLATTGPAIPWSTLLLVLFVVGLMCAVVRYLVGLYQINAIIHRSQKERLPDGTTLCMSDKEIAPFSWMNYVVLNGNDIPEQNQAIIRHEQAHVRMHHSYDMIFFDLFTSFFWFNPFSWLLRREIRAVHEYQADQQVLVNGIDARQYQLLLIRKCVGEQKFALANNFRQRDLHKRIQMMMKKSSEKQLKWRYVAAFPLLFLVMVALSVPKLNASIPEKTSDHSLAIALQEGDPTALPGDSVEQSKGALEARMVRIVTKDDSITVSANVGEQVDTVRVKVLNAKQKQMENVKVIRYGLMNQKDPISIVSVDGEGAQPLYILDGKEVASLSEFDPEQIESIEVLKQHATDKFGERGKEGVIHITTKKEVRKTIGFNDENKPLLILDGVIQDAAFELNSVSPDEIESIEVLKGNSAVKLYGEKGKNGVIQVHRKKKVE